MLRQPVVLATVGSVAVLALILYALYQMPPDHPIPEPQAPGLSDDAVTPPAYAATYRQCQQDLSHRSQQRVAGAQTVHVVYESPTHHRYEVVHHDAVDDVKLTMAYEDGLLHRTSNLGPDEEEQQVIPFDELRSPPLPYPWGHVLPLIEYTSSPDAWILGYDDVGIITATKEEVVRTTGKTAVQSIVFDSATHVPFEVTIELDGEVVFRLEIVDFESVAHDGQ